jgi:hypothetical protein
VIWQPIGRGGALLLLALWPSLAGAAGPDDERFYEPPPTLPETITGVVRPGTGSKIARVHRIRDVFEAVRGCWEPTGNGFTGQEITLRLAFKRSGEVLGQPRITYYKAGSDPESRETFARSVRAAFERCTPLPFTDSFGAAIAGRPFTFRFSDTRTL